MASTQSSQDIWHGRDRQPSARGNHRSESRCLQYQIRPSKTWTFKRDHCPGDVHEGDSVKVFSRSDDAWFDGNVIKFEEGNFVRVEYAVGEHLRSKWLHLHSDHLIISSIITSPVQDCDPSGLIDSCLQGVFPKACELSKNCSELLGVSVAYLETEFLAEIDFVFGGGADPNYYDINKKMLFGPSGKGLNRTCPRDGLPHCSYVDALPGCYTGCATVMLSWSWQYTARTVVGALSRWCRRNNMNPSKVYVWQCALCCNQYRVEDKKAMQMWEPFEVFKALFEHRVVGIGHILAILAPWQSPLYFNRIWCVFEFWMALQTKDCKLDILLAEEEETSCQAALEAGGMLVMYDLFTRVELQNAHATSQADKVNILKLVDPEATNYNESRKVQSLNAAVIQHLLQWLVGVAEKSVEREDRPDACCRKGIQAAELMRRAADWPGSLRVLERSRCIAEAQRATRTLDYCAVLVSIVKHHVKYEEHLKARELFDEVEQTFQVADLTQTEEYATFIKYMGTYTREQHDYPKAMELFEKAKRTYEAAGATQTEAYSGLLQRMGTCYRKTGDHKKALELYEDMQSRLELAGKRRFSNHGVLMMNMGTCFSEMGNYQQAMDCFEKAEHAYEQAGAMLTPGYATFFKRMGECFYRQGALLKAVEYFQKAKSTYESANSTHMADYLSLMQDMEIIQGPKQKNI